MLGRLFAAFLHFETIQLVCQDTSRLRHLGRPVEFRSVEIQQSFLVTTVNGVRMDEMKFQKLETHRYMNG